VGCLGGCLTQLLGGFLMAVLGAVAGAVYRLARLVNPRRAVAAILLTVAGLALWNWLRALGVRRDPGTAFLVTVTVVAAAFLIATHRGRIRTWLDSLVRLAPGTTVSGTVKGVLRREVQRRGFMYDYAEHILELKLEVTPGSYYRVEMRGRDIVGAVDVGDTVDVIGRVDAHNILQANRITNHSQHCTVTARWI